MAVKKERQQDNFIKLYRDVIYAIGLENAIVLGQLIGCEEMFSDKDDFYQTNKFISYYTGLSGAKVKRALKTLEEYKLINVIRHKSMNRNHYTINHFAINLIHSISKELNDKPITTKTKVIRTDLHKYWYLNYVKDNSYIDKFILKSGIDLDTIKETNEKTILKNLNMKENKIFECSSINKNLDEFFSKLNKKDRLLINEKLINHPKTTLFIATYLDVFKVMHPELKLKKVNDYETASNLMLMIKRNIDYFEWLNGKFTEKELIYIFLECWKYLLLDNRIYKNQNVDYAIFMFVGNNNSLTKDKNGFFLNGNYLTYAYERIGKIK